MARFFETFNVIESTGAWTRSPREGYPIDTLSAGFTSIMTSICAPAARPTPPDYDMGESVFPFAIIGNQVMPVRCTPAEASEQILAMMVGATEYRASEALWYGVDDDENVQAGPKLGRMYLKHPDITTVTRGANSAVTLAKVIAEAYRRNPHIRPVVHLGFQTAMELQFGLQNLKLPFVIPPAYPIDAIAVTDQVTVHVSPISGAQSVRRTDNRREFEVTRFGAIEFDPHLAVRAADSV